jgi:hypothetical protein
VQFHGTVVESAEQSLELWEAMMGSNLKAGLVSGTIIFFIGLAVLMSSLLWNDEKTVRETGTEAKAIVLNKQAVTYADKDGHTGEHYFVDFEFADDKAAKHQGRRTVHQDVYNSATIGQTIDVKYLPNKPDVVRVTAESDADSGLGPTLSGIGSLLIFAGMGVILWSATKFKAQRRSIINFK